MGFTQGIAIKYAAFTLCCSTLLAHLDDLHRVLRRDTHDLKSRIISRINGALKEQVYESKPQDLDDAVRALAPRLQSEQVSVETINPDAARVIEKILADIKQKAPDWQYEAEIERPREWGEKMSRQYYAGTPWPKTQTRLTTNTNIIFEYAGRLDTAVQGQNTYEYKVAPMAFYPKYRHASADEPEDNIILVRFSFEHNFSTYLAYPFFFFHEYASHVHGANSDTSIFDDGWMMYVIHKPTVQIRNSLPSTYWLSNDQIQAIDKHCPHKLSSDLLQRYYYLAQHIDKLTFRFKQLTLDLAGYPLTQENPYFLADFLERLAYHFDQNPHDLIRKIESYTSIDDLFMRLPPP